MKAIVQDKYGSLEGWRLREIDKPTPGRDQVLVRVRAASLHPDIWHVALGRPLVLRLMGGGLFHPKNPVPGTDMAGVVASVGDRVTRFTPGDEVFGETTDRHVWSNGGAFAEYVCVSPDWLALKPPNVSFEEAAALPTAGFIALQNLRGARHQWRGRRVLVNGAGGGVGSIALQVAKACGAEVTGVDCGKKLGLLRAMGADHVIDYTREDFTGSSIRYDFIFDVPGNHSLSECRRALKPDGKYALIGHEGFQASRRPVFGLFPRFFKLIFCSFFLQQLRLGRSSIPDRREVMDTLMELLEAGKLKPVIDSVHPLSQAKEALQLMVQGEPLGRVVLTAPTQDALSM